MAIIAILDLQLDDRHDGNDCVFNGYLEDYLSLYEKDLDPILKQAFSTIESKHPDVKVCFGLKSEISKDAISNQIIRYKDVFKLEGKPLVYPYLLYGEKEGEERALLVLPYTEAGPLYAKGYYYCMTEPGSAFIDCKNEIVAMSSNQPEKIAETFERLFTEKAGAIQRALDGEVYKNYDELKEKALAASEAQKEEAKNLLPDLEDRNNVINQHIVNWFLLKKILYVQYMVNKDILNQVHEGNIKKQRNQAKLNADEVSFLSYSEMWRRKKGEESEISNA